MKPDSSPSDEGIRLAGTWQHTDGVHWWGDLKPDCLLRIASHLQSGVDPGRDAPVTPWAVAVPRGRGQLAVTASPTLRSGLFYATHPRRNPIVGVNCRDVLAEMPGQLALEWGFLYAFARGVPPGDRTPFAQVRRLTAGRTLLVDGDDLREVPWLEAASDASPLDQTYLHAFDDALIELVDHDREPVVAMSGGLDSVFLVGSLVELLPQDRRIHAFVHRPVAGCHVTTPPGWVADDGPWVAAVRDFVGDRLEIHEVRNDEGILALDAAARQVAESWWPVWNPGNAVWLSAIHRRAVAMGAKGLLSGAAGNFTFSYPTTGQVAVIGGHGTERSKLRAPTAVLRRMRQPGQRTPIHWLEPPVFRDLMTKEPSDPYERYAQRVTGAARPHAAQLAPGLMGRLTTLDPFGTRHVMEMALARGPDGWPRGPLGRAFARRVSATRVPDVVRRRMSRGMQSADTWCVASHHRERYLDEISALHDTPGLGDWLDTRHLSRHVAGWHWGTQEGPPIAHLRAVNRILTLSTFVNTMVAPSRRARLEPGVH